MKQAKIKYFPELPRLIDCSWPGKDEIPVRWTFIFCVHPSSGRETRYTTTTHARRVLYQSRKRKKSLRTCFKTLNKNLLFPTSDWYFKGTPTTLLFPLPSYLFYSRISNYNASTEGVLDFGLLCVVFGKVSSYVRRVVQIANG